MKKTAILLALVGATGISTVANAELLQRPGGMVYDDVRNITWLTDANYAKTSGYTQNLSENANGLGFMQAIQAITWAADLAYGGYDDWRLPITQQPDGSCDDSYLSGGFVVSNGDDCTGSEMGNLFYVNLGGIKGVDISTHHNQNYDLFSNIGRTMYWSGTRHPYEALFDDKHYAFGFESVPHPGRQQVHADINTYLAWAVRDGDVAAVPMPEPATALLFGLGVVGLGLTLSGRAKMYS